MYPHSYFISIVSYFNLVLITSLRAPRPEDGCCSCHCLSRVLSGVAVPSSQGPGLASDPAIFWHRDDFDLSPE